MRRRALKVIRKEEIPKNANVLPGCSVLALKSTEEVKVKRKARLFIRTTTNASTKW